MAGCAFAVPVPVLPGEAPKVTAIGSLMRSTIERVAGVSRPWDVGSLSGLRCADIRTELSYPPLVATFVASMVLARNRSSRLGNRCQVKKLCYGGQAC